MTQKRFVDDLCRSLSSSKTTERKKGRKILESLVKDDKDFVVFSDRQWWDILSNALEFENLEMADDVKKSRKLNNLNGNASFVKNTAIHAIMRIPITTLRSTHVIDHILRILYDRNTEFKYKEEHHNLLSELLKAFRFVHTISLQTTIDIYNYIKRLILDDLSTSERSDNNSSTTGALGTKGSYGFKLMKSFCKSLFRDIIQTTLLETILTWFADLLNITNGNISLQGLTLTTILDCYQILLEYHGINILSLCLAHSEQLLKILLQQITISNVIIKDSYNKFLFQFLKLFLSSNYTSYLSSQSIIDKLTDIIHNLCSSMTSDYYLRILISHAHSHVGSRSVQSKEGFIRSLDDSKTRLNFEVIVLLCRVDELLLQHCRNNSWKPFVPSDFPLTGSSMRIPPSQSPHPLPLNNSSAARQPPSGNGGGEVQDRGSRVLDLVLIRIKNVSLRQIGTRTATTNNSNNSSGLTQVLQPVPPHTATNFTGYSQVPGSAGAGGAGLSGSGSVSVNRQASLFLLEGLLLTITHAAGQESSGDFLAGDTKSRCDRVCHWISSLRDLLSTMTEYPNETQIIGNIMFCLYNLSSLNDEGFQSTPDLFYKLQYEWTCLLELFVMKDVYLKYLSKQVKRCSVTELIFRIISQTLSKRYILLSSLAIYLQSFWNASGLTQPLGIESCAVFELLGYLVHHSALSIPAAFVNKSMELFGICDDQACDPEWLSAMVSSTDQRRSCSSTSSTRGAIREYPVEVLSSPVVLYLVWLHYQLAGSALSRTSLQGQTVGYINAFHSLLQSIFGTFSTTHSHYSGLSTEPLVPTVYWERGENGCWEEEDWLNPLPSPQPFTSSSPQHLGVACVQSRGGTPCSTLKSSLSIVEGTVPTGLVQLVSLTATHLSSFCSILERIYDNELKVQETVDIITSWQTVSLLLTAAVTSFLSQTIQIISCFPDVTEVLRSVVRSLERKYWSLMQRVIAVVQSRVKSIKTDAMMEYLSVTSQLIQKHITTLKPDNVLKTDRELQDKKNEMVNQIFSLMRSVRGLALNSSDITVSAADNLNYHRPESSHIGTEIGPGTAKGSRKRGRQVEVEEDDFMEDSPPKKEMYTPPSTTSLESFVEASKGYDPRLRFSKDLLMIISSLAQCAITLSPENETAYRIFNLFIWLDNEQKSPIATDHEYFLLMAAKLAEVSQVDGIHDFFIDPHVLWDTTWGILGYYKVLCILNDLLDDTLHASRQIENSIIILPVGAGSGANDSIRNLHSDRYETIISEYVDMGFATEGSGSIAKYPVTFWRIRYMQVLVGSKLFQGNPKACKELFATLLSKSLADIDHRVRELAGKHLPLLFHVFPKHRPIYESMSGASAIDFDITSHALDPSQGSTTTNNCHNENLNYDNKTTLLIVISTVNAITEMAVSSASFLHQALFDIILCCCSRVKMNQNLYQLLQDSIVRIAIAHHYHSVANLISNHIYYLLYKWLNMAAPEVGVSTLQLHDFPYFLLGMTSLKEFLLTFGDEIISSISELKPQQYRWKCLLEYAERTGYTGTDQGIATLIRTHFIILKSKEILYLSVSRIIEQHVDLFEVSESVKTFLNRILFDTEEQKTLIMSHASDIILYIFELYCSDLFEAYDVFPPVINWKQHNDFDLAVIEISQITDSLVNDVLSQISYLCGYDRISKLLQSANLLELIRSLRGMFMMTSCVSKRFRVIQLIRVIIKHIHFQSRPVYCSLFFTLIGASRTSLLHMPVLTESIHEMVLSMDRDKTLNLHSPSSLILDKLGTLILDIFADLLSLHHVLSLWLNKISLPNTRVLEDTSTLTDEFSVSNYTDLIKDIKNLIGNHQLEQVKNYLQKALVSLESSIAIVLRWNSKDGTAEYFHLCLPLPNPLFLTLSDDIRASLEGNIWSIDIEECLSDLSEYTSSLILDYPVSLTGVWLRIYRLSFYFDDGFRGNNFKEDQYSKSSSSSSSGYTSLWSAYPSLVSKCISNMIHLRDDTSRRIPPVLIQYICSIIGSLGVPEVNMLTHAQFPVQETDWSFVSSNKMKSHLTARLFNIVCYHEDIKMSMISSSVLRSLSRIGILKELFSKSKSSNLKDFLELYQNSTHIRIIDSLNCVPYSEREGTGEQFINALDSMLWESMGKDHNNWITDLVSTFIATGYSNLLSDRLPGPHNVDTKPHTTSSARVVPSARQSSQCTPIHGSDLLVACLGRMCSYRADFAEKVFPLVLEDIIQQNGLESDAVQQLSLTVKNHLLNDSASVDSVRVICDVLMFLTTQSKNRFINSRSIINLNKGRGGIVSTATASGSKDEDLLPYSYGLNVDLETATKAAMKCGYTATAMIFAEFATTQRARIQEKYLPLGSVACPIAPEILLQIFRSMHDPDAVLTVSTNQSLYMQAEIFSHTGHHMESLATYESIIQLSSGEPTGGASAGYKQNRTPLEESDSATIGIMRSLLGLGSSHVLSQYAMNREDCRGVRTASVAEITSESSWRFLEVTRRADLELREWTPILGCDTGPSYSRTHYVIAEDSMDREVLGFGRMNKESLITGGNVLQGIEYFILQARDEYLNRFLNDNISHCINDIRHGQLDSCLVHIQKSYHSLFPKLNNLCRQQSAHGLIHDLSKLQLLKEIEEVIYFISSSTAITPAYSPTTVRVDRFLKVWRNRLQGGTSSEVVGEKILSLRLKLLESLLQLEKVTPVEVVGFMDQIHDCVGNRASVAHSISPLVYKLKHMLLKDGYSEFKPRHYLGQGSEDYVDISLLSCEWSLQEGKLLWKKGLSDAAKFSLGSNIVDKLKELTNDQHENEADMTLLNPEQKLRADSILSETLRTLGNWLVVKRSAHIPEIMTNYLYPSVSSAHDIEKKIDAHLSLGSCNASLFNSVKWRISSSEWQQRLRVAAERKAELDSCRSMHKDYSRRKQAGEVVSDDDLRSLTRHLNALIKEVEIDTKEQNGVRKSMHRYLVESLKQYAIVLELSREDDQEAIFLVVNLWFDNAMLDEVNDIMLEIVQKTASFKFIPLTYQILSRLGGNVEDFDSSDMPLYTQATTSTQQRTSNSNDDEKNKTEKIDSFRRTLNNLVYHLCADHPHHTLPQLIALSNEEHVGEYAGASQFRNNILQDRLKTANQILSQLKNNQKISGLVASMETLLAAYIRLAMANTKKFTDAGRTKDLTFRELLVSPSGREGAFHECLKSVIDGGHVSCFPAVLTYTAPVRRDKSYGDIVRISKFIPTFSITDSGISRPKIIQCVGTDGLYYKQLVKGGDDMRQDAVLEQVFLVTNFILRRDTQSRQRLLSIRTYKIIPTSPQTGVLEWVDNTIPFGSYLCDRDKMTGAHSRYHPNDWSHVVCREKLKDAKDSDDKLRVFREICSHFQPAFRYFFLEYFGDPRKWLSARLAYIRSVAVTSMIGYILGIGDRHSHNILIDTDTAEVIHIDFGIMFEQGRLLSTPETVPFRLTRDIVDGFGIMGTDGTFQRCCEETLRVLRENSQQIRTILEVVIHDPLYKWSLSPLQAKARQVVNENQEDLSDVKVSKDLIKISKTDKSPRSAGNNTRSGQSKQAAFVSNKQEKGLQRTSKRTSRDAAERALMRIKDKLHGHDDPTGDSLSVEGQVKMLIVDAQHEGRLSALFPGWAPWL